MKQLTTVLEEIFPGTLGFCHSHEHLSIDKGQSYRMNPALCIDDTDLTAKELETFKLADGRAVVDAQPVGCGRNAKSLVTLSKESGIHIIASTGFHKIPFYPLNHWVFSYSRKQLADIFIRELEDGMFVDADNAIPARQIGARAGMIKAALESGEMDDPYRKLFRAAAEAGRATGAALMVHIEKGSDPIRLADFLQESGIRANRIIFCHMDRMIPNLEIHKELCARGLYMEYDTIGRPRYHDDDVEAYIVMEMIAAGYEDQILMGLDVTRDRMLSYGGGVGLDYIVRQFVPLLLAHGVSQKVIDKVFIDNPSGVFIR